MTSDTITEARLFYSADPSAALAELTDALTGAYAQSNLDLRPLYRQGGDQVFGIGELTLSITCAVDGLDMARLDSAKRPECAVAGNSALRDRLAVHRSAVAIRITGPARAAKPETRLALVYIATMQVLRLAQPGLVHWARTDTLYTIEEFRSSTGAHRPVHPARPTRAGAAARAAAGSAPRPKIPAAIKGRSFTPSDKVSDLPANAPARAPGRLQRLLGRGAMASMGAPLSLGYLAQMLLPGGKLG